MRFCAFVIPLLLSACGASTADPTPRPTPLATTSSSAQVTPPAPPTSASAATPMPLASSAAAVVPPAPPGIPKRDLQIVQSINVGKWPEGVTLAGETAWVAESGQRQLAKIDLQTAKVVSHLDVGRLPVNLVTGPGDVVYALEVTDQKVRQIDTQGKTSEFAKLPDAPQFLAIDDDALWVLLWEKASSAAATVMRIDLKKKTKKRSAKLGPNAWQLGVGHDFVWVGHDGRISILDKVKLAKKTEIALDDGSHADAPGKRKAFGRIAVGPRAVYSDYNLGVVRVDPKQFGITHRKELGQLPLYMVATDKDLWVAGREGSIWQLDPDTLDVRAEHKLSFVLQFHDLKVRNELLFVTDFPRPGSSDDGRLLILRPLSEAK